MAPISSAFSLICIIAASSACSQTHPPGKFSMAFTSIPTSPTKASSSCESAPVREVQAGLDQARSRAPDAPAIRRLLFPAEVDPNDRQQNLARDFCPKSISSFASVEKCSVTNCTDRMNFPAVTEPIENRHGIQQETRESQQYLKDSRRNTGKRSFNLKKIFAFEDYMNSTQAWTSSCATLLLSLHARAQLRISEFKDTRTVKAFVEDLPKIARRIAPSTPTRFERVEVLAESKYL